MFFIRAEHQHPYTQMQPRACDDAAVAVQKRAARASCVVHGWAQAAHASGSAIGLWVSRAPLPLPAPPRSSV